MTVHAVPREEPSGKKSLKVSETPLGRHLRGLAVAYERVSKNSEHGAGLRQAADIVDSQVGGEIHHAALLDLFQQLVGALMRAVEEIREVAADLKAGHVDDGVTPVARTAATVRASPRLPRSTSARPDGLPAGEARVLVAVASFKTGITREHITILTGYKRSTRDAYILRLRDRELIEGDDRIVATAAGFAVFGENFKRIPTGKKAADHWERTLPGGEAVIFEHVRGAGKEGITRDRLSELTGYKRSTRDAYLLRLRTRELIRDTGDVIVLREELR